MCTKWDYFSKYQCESDVEIIYKSISALTVNDMYDIYTDYGWMLDNETKLN